MPNLSASPSQIEKDIVPHYLFNSLGHYASLGWWANQIQNIDLFDYYYMEIRAI